MSAPPSCQEFEEEDGMSLSEDSDCLAYSSKWGNCFALRASKEIQAEVFEMGRRLNKKQCGFTWGLIAHLPNETSQEHW